MAERLKIRAKPAEGLSSEDAALPPVRRRARAAARGVGEALRAAKSVLPSRDATRNGSEKLLLIGIVGTPFWLLAPWFVSHSREVARAYLVGGVRAIACAAALTATLTVGPFVASALLTFVASLVFMLATRRSGSRVQQALVCPYCRDQVEQEGTLSCARKGCGALYHRECWDECAVQYGGCAIYGCSSKKSREVSAAGFLLRLSRLAVAAALFPPRMARALRERGSEEMPRVYDKAIESANGWQKFLAGTPLKRGFFWFGLGIPIAICTSWAILSRAAAQGHMSGQVGYMMMAFLTIPLLLMGIPFVLALPSALVYYTLRAIATIFGNELAALTRADAGGGSVIGRLRLGLGSKKGH